MLKLQCRQKEKKMCSIGEKFQALERLDKGESVMKVKIMKAKIIGVGVTTVKVWKRNRENIQSFSLTCDSNPNFRKTIKRPILETLDEALWIWFCQEREKGTPLSGPLIKEKAYLLHLKLNDNEKTFTASEGWLNRWNKRHGIQQMKICGEKLSADNVASKQFIKKFEALLKEHSLTSEQVYNIDETGLNYKMLPNKTLAARNGPSITGYKLIKDRLTIASCSNASENHKLELFVIGKSWKPRAFKHLNPSSLPLYYRAQKSA